MKKPFLATICFLLILVNYNYADVGNRHFEKTGGFSLVAPSGWTFHELRGLKYAIIYGAAIDSFRSNIYIVDEPYQGSLRSYVDSNMTTIRKERKDFILIKREAFVTNKGIEAEKVISINKQNNKLLRQTFFFFPASKGKYFIATCSTLAEGGEKLDSALSESMKTFEIIN